MVVLVLVLTSGGFYVVVFGFLVIGWFFWVGLVALSWLGSGGFLAISDFVGGWNVSASWLCLWVLFRVFGVVGWIVFGFGVSDVLGWVS